jgi:putative addiction module component (TIGR02574 family)
MSKVEQIQNEIMSLSQEERELLNIFMKNSNAEQTTEYQDAWKGELERRLREVETASVSMISTKTVLADIRSKIRS